MAHYDEAGESVPLTRAAGVLANYAGAAVSLGLMIGVGLWGYQLIMRDVTGIPVVRAMDGEMRVAPDNPGGEVAAHTGLAVNAVAAVGEAAPSEDVLVLAPATPGLAPEDLAVQPMAEAGEIRASDAPVSEDETPVAAVLSNPEDGTPERLNADDILALADQIAAGAVPMGALEGETVAPTVALDGEIVTEPEATEVAVIPASVPGVARSQRPILRPATLVQAKARSTGGSATDASAVMAALAEANNVEVARAELPVGTKLVQLGAFPSAEGAATAWTALQGRFGDYMTGKDRLIQEASSGGRTFFRLRAQGFDDLAEARRFCAALSAGNADCIPVVVR